MKIIKSRYIHISFAFALIFIEAISVSLSVDALLVVSDGFLGLLLSQMGNILRVVIVASAVFAILLYYCKRSETTDFLRSFHSISLTFLVIHLALFGLFFYTTLQVFAPDVDNQSLGMLWLVLLLSVLITWICLLSSVEHLFKFIKNHYAMAGYSIIIAIVIVVTTYYAGDLWRPLSIITFYGSDILLSLVYSDIYIESNEKLLGTSHFVVHIAPVCSGLEGLIVALIVTGIYLFILKKELVFPLSFMLLPIAAILAIAFNVLRITFLIMIGSSISPEIAVGGFHSVAGWIAAVIVSFLIIFVFSSVSIFHKEKKQLNITQQEKSYNDSDLAWAILIPFILTLFTTLVSQLFISDFNYLYPIKVLAGSLSLLYFWKIYTLKIPEKWLESILAGTVVTLLWVLFVPNDSDFSADFIAHLTDMPPALMIAWLTFRVFGFWLIAPIVEELVFRGYLIARISGQALKNENHLSLSIPAIIVSSVLFGVMHSAFVAGCIAGFIFAIVRYRSSSLSEPILAHMVANILVFIWAIITGQWGLL